MESTNLERNAMIVTGHSDYSIFHVSPKKLIQLTTYVIQKSINIEVLHYFILKFKI